MFEPFYTTKTSTGGTGIGLDLIKTYIVSMGGKIDLTSTPDVGTTFTINLPKRHPQCKEKQI